MQEFMFLLECSYMGKVTWEEFNSPRGKAQ